MNIAKQFAQKIQTFDESENGAEKTLIPANFEAKIFKASMSAAVITEKNDANFVLAKNHSLSFGLIEVSRRIIAKAKIALNIIGITKKKRLEKKKNEN